MPGSSFPLKYQSLPSHPARVSLEAGSPMSRPRSNTTSRAARWTESYHRLLGPRHGYSAVDPPQRLWQRGLFWRRIALGLGVIGVLSWSVADVRSRSEKNGGGIDVLAADLSSGRNNSRSRLPARGKAKKAMGVRVWNDDYQVSSGQQTLELYPWDHVAEPHRTTVMEIASWPEPGDDQVLNFRWVVGGVVLATGVSLETTFDSPGEYQCSVTAFYSSSSTTATEGDSERSDDASDDASDVPDHSFVVTVKYVRREIRALTDRDREIFFNAVAIIQRVPSAVGQRIYGNKFYSKDYFNRLHLQYGGQQDCDHWHDGAGFVTAHIAVSLMFEQSLQAINPSIALPYWDFTVEGTAYDWTDFRSSGVFSDDWFGTAAPRNDLMTPDLGRFAFVPTMANASEYSTLTNAYGLLRSPWNTDPNPFLTRHDHVFGFVNNRKPAGCKQYRDAVRQSSWMSLTESLNAGAHGHIHELMGGTWSANWHEFRTRTEEIIFPFVHDIVPLMKYLWRVGYIQCPKSCGFEVPWEECQCVCSDRAMPGKSPAEVLEGSGLLSKDVGAFFYDNTLKLVDNLTDEEGHAQSQIPGYTKEETDAIFAELLDVLCTPMKSGSHYEGTSTNDITFWVLHPTFDRLWHLSRLESVPSFDETWLGHHSCSGHNPDDIQPFHNLFVGESVTKGLDKDCTGGSCDDGSNGKGQDVQVPKQYYTNTQLYDLLSPDGMAIPYVYDHFKWPHCDAIGIFMRGHVP